MEVRRATITAVGHYVPEKILTNADLEKMVDTNDEWIRTRTGIRERRILEQGATSDLAVKAVQQVLAHRGITAEEIDLIIVATITPDMMLPATACPRHTARPNSTTSTRLRRLSVRSSRRTATRPVRPR